MKQQVFLVWLSVAATSTLGLVACGDDTSGTGGSSSSTTTSSSSGPSTSSGQGGEGGDGGSSTGGGGEGGGSQSNTTQQIVAVLTTSDGGGKNLPIAGATVTYVREALGDDPAGFFIQAQQAGPALFVAVDPTTLSPSPEVGDEVSFTVTAVATTNAIKHATAVSSYSRSSTDNDVTPLIADLSNATDVVSNLNAYTSRVISITGEIDGDFSFAGAQHVQAKLKTTGVDNNNLRIRMPPAVRDYYELAPGCTVTIGHGIMWRFNPVANPSAPSIDDISGGNCGAPNVVNAAASSATSVYLTFSRNIDPASVQPADFVFTGGLTASAVAVDGKNVTVTTSAQTGGTTYTVTVSGVNDRLGQAIGTPNSADFNGFEPLASAIINEYNPNISGGRDVLELLVTAPGSTAGLTLVEEGTTVSTMATFPAAQVAAGDLIVVHFNVSDLFGVAPASETTAKNQYPNATYGANFDNAWDFHGREGGVAYGNRVIKLTAPGNVLLDAVPFVRTDQVVGDSMNAPLAAFPGRLQALQLLGRWLPADCGGQLCTYSSTPEARAISVNMLGVGTNRAGNSISRKPGMNTMQASDWNAAGAPSWGAVNP